MDTQKNSGTSEEGLDFMLAEYTTLRELRISLNSLGESRVNFFLATISGAIVGLALINQLSGFVELVYFINGAVFVGLILFGWITFARMVERTVKIAFYRDRMDQIRSYFAEEYPKIKPYLWLRRTAEKPVSTIPVFNIKAKRFGLTGLAPMVAVVNSIIITVGVVILTSVLLFLPIGWSLLIGTTVFFLVVLGHYSYLVNRYRQGREDMGTI